MITYSIIQKSQLEGGLRLDAEYYQPEYLDLEEKLNSLQTKTIEEISKSVVSFGAYSLTSHIEWQESGVPYVNVGDIHDGYIDLDNVKYISEKVDEILKKSRVNNGQVLLTMAGTIGNAAVAHNLPKRVNANQAIAKITPLDNTPYYLAAFLNSKYGLLQTQREIVSSVQANIFLGPIKKFRVPIFNQEITNEIANKYKIFLNELENSKHLYSQAENLLLEELGLRDFKVKDELSYIVNLSEIKSAHRADAEYFQPIYKNLESRIKNFEYKRLDEIFSIRRGDFINPDYYVERAKRGYIRIKELPVKGDINSDAITYIDDNFPGRNLDILQEGDFVFAGIGATLGKTARISKELEGFFYSNNTVRFRLKNDWKYKVDIRYSQAVLQSMICQLQFEQRQAQTAQAKIADEELKTVLIPILPKPIQQKIADLVQKSHEARKKAKQLLEQAKYKVEQLIESKK